MLTPRKSARIRAMMMMELINLTICVGFVSVWVLVGSVLVRD
jgi:hypothetical protein